MSQKLDDGHWAGDRSSRAACDGTKCLANHRSDRCRRRRGRARYCEWPAMNRKQRRAAASPHKRALGGSQRGASTPALEILMHAAIVRQQAGQLAEAERLYRQILASDPGHVGSLHNLGLIAHGRGQHAEAIALIETALSVNDRISVCHNSLGLILCAVGRFAEAILHYEKALALDPRNAQAHNNLGNALKSQGRTDEAMAQFRRA